MPEQAAISVGIIPYEVSDTQVQVFFEQFGTVTRSVRVNHNQNLAYVVYSGKRLVFFRKLNVFFRVMQS